ncbi:MAG: HAD family phosphatase [Candidatus Omnitrophica bacterium]|nr:HAD family phosphatase [Candidatus Omnitrophota bacterium]
MSAACRLVLFDLGNVLVRFDHAILARKLSKLSRKPIFAIVSQFIRSGLGELYDEGRIDTEDFTGRVLRALDLKMSPEEFKACWTEIFWENPGMDELVGRLKARYPVFVISDTNPMHFDFVRERFPILRHIDQFVLSYEVGARKPHPKMFEAALRRAGCAAEETFFTDDRSEIIEAARRMGFRTHRFTGTRALARELLKQGILPEAGSG